MANGIYFKCDRCGHAYHLPKDLEDIKLPKGWIKMEMEVVTEYKSEREGFPYYSKSLQEVHMCGYNCAESFILIQSQLMEKYKRENMEV